MEELKQEILRGKQRKREQSYNLAQFNSSSHPSQSMVRSSWKTSKGVPGSLVGNRSLCVFSDSVCSVEDRHCAAGKGGFVDAEHDYPGLQSSGGNRHPRHLGHAVPPSLRHRARACRLTARLHPRSANHQT